MLQAQIAPLLTRPVGRPPHDIRRFYASFRYRAQSWSRARRVVAKVEWHPGELYPRVGFIVTNLRRSAKRVVAFYNGPGTAEQWIKEGKHAVKWTRLSCTTFRANAVRLQLHALAYNLANFLRTLALPREVAEWSLTSLREKVVKIGAKVVAHGRYLVFQMAEVAVPQDAVPAPPRPDRRTAPTRRGPMLTREGLRPLPPQGRRASAACPTTASRGREEPWCVASRQPFGPNQVTTGQKSLAGRGRSALHADASRDSARSSGNVGSVSQFGAHMALYVQAYESDDAV